MFCVNIDFWVTKLLYIILLLVSIYLKTNRIFMLYQLILKVDIVPFLDMFTYVHINNICML